ncbi:cell division protein SepF [Protaetiibacter sp. SSC-01]|uniref:cell division protein SepF n=1 Tax=Protaetiibacter sp. SSC-01 TaxID=2759943 RepID=UPI0016575F61|nr:cell division protein SepF [Protaetiibacter sp. SSC-01]QNO36494.1 cell division protein SepF [Protaetiibacter sp. SSC-01]
MANPLRKTMVYLGLADEEYDDVAPEQAAPAPRETAAAASAPVNSRPAPVTPLRRAAAPRTAPSGMNEILTVHPRHYKDAQTIAESFREGVPVIINLSQMSEPEARRLIDFASGLSMGLYGKIERVTNKVFLLSPEHVAVSGDQAEADAEVDAGFFETH